MRLTLGFTPLCTLLLARVGIGCESLVDGRECVAAAPNAFCSAAVAWRRRSPRPPGCFPEWNGSAHRGLAVAVIATVRVGVDAIDAVLAGRRSGHVAHRCSVPRATPTSLRLMPIAR